MPSSRPPAPRRICLVTSSHLVSNPRLLKEADALHEAGYRVRVVSGGNHPPARLQDQILLEQAPWTARVVESAGGWGSWSGRFLRRGVRLLHRNKPFTSLGDALLAHHPTAGGLLAAAREEPADLFIGHTLAGLAAAGMAAEAGGACLGFDAEDFHPQETSFSMEDPAEAAAIRHIEETLIPRCRYITAASPMIAQAYATAYSVPLPTTVLNVFPLAWAPPPRSDSPDRTGDDVFRMYWFSQTIGPGRGLETMVDTACLMQPGVELLLRGHPIPGYVEGLSARAAARGRPDLVRVLPSAPPDQMAVLASDADLGLSLEEFQPPNRDICLTNKVFTYLLAGIPQLMTPTRAQSALAGELGEAVILSDPLRCADTAQRLEQFRRDTSLRKRASRAARTLAHERYCWEVEKEVLLGSIERLWN